MCGLNLSAAGVDLNTHIRQTRSRSGRWLVLFILLFGISALMGMFISLRRVGPPRHRVPVIIHEITDEQENGTFQQQVELSWEKQYPRRPSSGRIPTH